MVSEYETKATEPLIVGLGGVTSERIREVATREGWMIVMGPARVIPVAQLAIRLAIAGQRQELDPVPLQAC